MTKLLHQKHKNMALCWGEPGTSQVSIHKSRGRSIAGYFQQAIFLPAT